ncbi:MAG: multidrug transporter MatE [Firmicutes bacterium]|nr:multidrug transporter MatE [Bacillota bacterium]
MNSPAGVEGSWKTFSRYVLPSVSAMVLFSMYTVVDGIFVSWGAGSDALTSVNIAMPFVNFLSGFSILISMGTATLVAFARGRGDTEEADGLFSQTVAVIVAVSLLITGLAAAFAEQIAAFLGAGPAYIGDSTAYLRIVSLFSVCFILSYCLEVMVKVDDSPVMAIVGVGASFLTNVVLDYVMVIVLDWGVRGAAWATGIAQVVSLLIFLAYFYSKRSHLKIRRFTPRPSAFKRIFPLGVADCSVEMIVAFLILIYNLVLRRVFGEESQAIYAVVAYINLFVFMVMQGVAQGMMHLVSLHMGKEEYGAVRGYFRMALLTCVGVSILLVAVCNLFPEVIAGLLMRSTEPMYQDTLYALQRFSLSFLFVGLNISIAGYLTAVEKAIPSVFLAVSRGFVFAPIALLLLAFTGGGQYVWFAALAGEAACFLVSLLVLQKSKATQFRQIQCKDTDIQ